MRGLVCGLVCERLTRDRLTRDRLTRDRKLRPPFGRNPARRLHCHAIERSRRAVGCLHDGIFIYCTRRRRRKFAVLAILRLANLNMSARQPPRIRCGRVGLWEMEGTRSASADEDLRCRSTRTNERTHERTNARTHERTHVRTESARKNGVEDEHPGAEHPGGENPGAVRRSCSVGCGYDAAPAVPRPRGRKRAVLRPPNREGAGGGFFTKWIIVFLHPRARRGRSVTPASPRAADAAETRAPHRFLLFSFGGEGTCTRVPARSVHRADGERG